MMEDKTIYLSGPISDGGKSTPEQQLQNVLTGEDIYGELMSKGYAVFCPQLSYYPDKRWREQGITKFQFDHPTWLAVDKQWVWKAKHFFYMLPEIYGESKGAAMELDWAKSWGKRIFTDINEVPSKHELVI